MEKKAIFRDPINMLDNLICNLSHLAFIAITGDKAAAFLQGQLTCDVREVTADMTRLGAYCNAKGRVLATLRLLQYENQFYACLPKAMAETTSAALQKIAMLSRVQLTPTENIAGIGCYGTAIAHNLAAIFGELPEKVDAAIYKNNALIVRISSDQPRFEIFGTPTVLAALKEQLKDYPQKDSTVWRLLDIQAGIPNIYPATRDLFTPHMINYPALNAVSFKKGCYVGQEVVARTHYLGKVKRQLQYSSEKNSVLAQPGDKILNAEGQETGVVIDAMQDAEGNSHILAVMQG